MMMISYYSQPLSTLLEQLNENQEQYIQGYIENESGEILLHTEGRDYIGMDSDEYKKKNEVTDLTEKIRIMDWQLSYSNR